MEELKDKHFEKPKRKPIWKDGIVMVLIVIFGFSFFAKDNRQQFEYRQPTYAIVTRSLNTGIQVNQYRDAFVSYSIQITANLSISGGQSGTCNLQISKDNGVTDPYKTIATQINNNLGTLIIGVNTINVQSGSLTGFCPAGYYIKLVTTGSAAFLYISGMEVAI